MMNRLAVLGQEHLRQATTADLPREMNVSIFLLFVFHVIDCKRYEYL